MIVIPFDNVITVCSHAELSCPVFTEKNQVTHVNLDKPPSLSKSTKQVDVVVLGNPKKWYSSVCQVHPLPNCRVFRHSFPSCQAFEMQSGYIVGVYYSFWLGYCSNQARSFIL